MNEPSLLILDVDGVMTDGTKIYGADGYAVYKSFCDHDFTAIKCFQSRGWKVCFLSADMTINRTIASNRDIDFWYSRDADGTINKVKWLKKLIDHYGITIDKTIYVGDDLFDIPIMKELFENGGNAFCPNNAAKPVKDFVITEKHIGNILTPGGYGAIMSLYCLIFENQEIIIPNH